MSYLLDHPGWIMLVIALLLVGAFHLGHRFGALAHVAENEDRHEQWKSVRDALSVLLSLLLGFTLAMSLSRYDHRRDLVVQEANAIATTYLRAGLLAPQQAGALQQVLRDYVVAREKFFDAGLNAAKLQQAQQATKELQERLWLECTEMTKNDRSAVAASFVTSLNQAIDLDAERLAALEYRIPMPVWALIVTVAFFDSLAYGATAKKYYLPPMIVLPVIIAVVCTLVADLDTSRSGLIRADQQAMERVKEDMGVR